MKIIKKARQPEGRRAFSGQVILRLGSYDNFFYSWIIASALEHGRQTKSIGLHCQ